MATKMKEAAPSATEPGDNEFPVKAPTAPAPVASTRHRDEELDLDSFEYVTGEVPYLTQEEMLLDQERGDDNRSKDSRDQEAPEEVVADRVAFDERDDVNTIDDVDRQGRRGQEERDWWGDMYADSGRGRPNDGSRRRR